MPTSIVDSHVHVWGDGLTYASPDHAVAGATHDDASVAVLLDAMTAANVSAAVLVQYIGYLWDNDYVARAIAARPDMFAGVCRVDPANPAAPDDLTYWTQDRGFQGVRLGPKADARGDWLTGPLMDPLFARAAALRIPVVILTEPARLPDLVRVLDRHPDVDVVIDHMADCDPGNPAHREMLRILAGNPRIYMKTGHLWIHSAHAYPWPDLHGLVKLGCDLFGPSRMMWGSDWPFSLHHGTYHQTTSFLRTGANFLGAADLGWIMGGTARRLWQFDRGQMAATHINQGGINPHSAKGD